MSISARIVTINPAEIGHVSEALQRTYEAMYRIPPGGAGEVPAMLAGHAARPGFRLRALQSDNDELLGLAYGFTGSPGQPWRDEMAAAVGDGLAREWLIDHFEFAEFGVVPGARRRGLGTRLYEAVFTDLPHVRAVLTVREDNAPALVFYARHSWRPLHHGFVPTAGHGPYAILGNLLTDT